MFPLFHIAFPLLIFEIPQIKKKYRINRLALIIGSILPDIIDKSFLFLKISSGRGYSHTLLFVLLFSAIFFFISKRNKALSLSLFIGLVFHLVLDLPSIPLFYPFIPYDFSMVHDPLPLWIHTLMTDPIVYTTEIIGGFILGFIIINNKLYSIEEITDYLKTNPVSPLLLKTEAKQEIQIVED